VGVEVTIREGQDDEREAEGMTSGFLYRVGGVAV
jgi:hypothetical protein